MPPHSVLPQDIYDIIIDDLSYDRLTLKECALVDSAWREASQKLLHQAMVFRTSPPPPKGAEPTRVYIPASDSEKIRLLLDTASHLLRHVRSISIRENRDNVTNRRCGTNRGPRREPSEIEPSLAVFLRSISTPALPLLSHIELGGLIWMMLNPDFQRALILLLSGRNIKHVKLLDCGIPFGVQGSILLVSVCRTKEQKTRSARLDPYLHCALHHYLHPSRVRYQQGTRHMTTQGYAGFQFMKAAH